MKKRFALAAATLLALTGSVFVFAPPAQAAVGIRISNGRLVEANGTPLILRGVNHAHTWFKSQTSSFAAIKAAGANAVRVVLSGGRWQPADDTAGVANVINLCKTNRLICVLENHDTTGFNEQGGAVSLDASVTYWNSVRTALIGQENYVILNIGNEPMGNGSSPAVSTWPTATANAIQRLRSLGFEHTIMVDAPNWGQDWQFVMRDNAPTVAAADPSGNTIFSVHMYGVFNNATVINAYLDSFVSRNLPLVVGEFGHNHSDGDPDENTIFSATQARNLGWMAWSWSGNGCCVEYLDMVQNNNGTFNHNVRSAWGERVITGANGLSTAREATIYSGGGNDTTPPTTPGTPTASNVTSTGASLAWAASTDQGGSGLAGYNIYREQGATDPLLAQSTTNSATLTGLTANTQYQVYVRARDGAGNLSGNSPLVTFTTQGGGGDVTPPTTPGTPTASNVTSTGASLAWAASTDQGGSGLAGYNIYREQGATDPLLAQSTTNSATLTGLTANTQYQVYVRARDGAGNLSGNSPLVTFTTQGGGTGVSCRVAYTISPWGTGSNGFTAGITLTNTGSAALTWTLTFTLPSGQAISMPGWSATYTPSGSNVSAVGLDWNRTLQAGQGAQFGFNGTHTGNTGEPSAFSVNGTACTVV